MNRLRECTHVFTEDLRYGTKEWEAATKDIPWIVIWLDGQTTHHDKESMDEARRNKIILATFIPHTTHHCQPLDRNVNTAIKVSTKT